MNKWSINEILVENSKVSRKTLKCRLYKDGILLPVCILCGQDENWNGLKISLIIDHINGINNDNRLENLRIVCPNCNAGLDTFAGRNIKNHKPAKINLCICGNVMDRSARKCKKCDAQIKQRVDRPDIEILKKEISDIGYSATGRKYGVSDNAIRKWVK